MRMPVLAVLAATAIGVAGCADIPGFGPPTASPSASPAPPASPAPSGQAAPAKVAACLVGNWQTDAVQGFTGLSGGSGAKLSVGTDGAILTDFSGMQPIAFTVKVGETTIKGRFAYSGQASGKIGTDSATATSGRWEPVGPVDWAQVRVTLDLTEPVVAKPFDNVPIRDLLGEKANPRQTGGVVDIAPMLGSGTYTCEGTTKLTLTPQDTHGLKWTFTKR
jgi:hypothetical protein